MLKRNFVEAMIATVAKLEILQRSCKITFCTGLDYIGGSIVSVLSIVSCTPHLK